MRSGSGGQRILVDASPFETRVALVLGGDLHEIHHARDGARSCTGNVYLGVVRRVMPGMQAAFVDIGLERPGFLHLRDVQAPGPHPAATALGSGAPWEPRIQDLLHQDQRLLVQVTKDPISTKGARLTTHVALASRFLVLMPNSTHLGVSHRIASSAERQRLRALLETHLARYGRADHHGFIVRTAAEGAGEAEFALDVNFLERLWREILQARQRARPPALIYEELPLPVRVVRDLVSADLDEIVVDDPDVHEHLMRFVARFLPDYTDCVRLHREAVPLFERAGIEAEIERAMRSHVPLRSGGGLVIEQTEAMTTIDVNSGGFTRGVDLEDTGFRTNIEAAEAIPRQLRLRNLGGIIVVDFIDMQDQGHRETVLDALVRQFDQDPARVRVHGFSALGLVEISRKRTRDSLSRQLLGSCDACDGRGVRLTPESAVLRILRELQAAEQRLAGEAIGPGGVVMTGGGSPRRWIVRCGQAVLDCLLDEMAAEVRRFEARWQVRLELQLEPSYGTEAHDLARIDRAADDPGC